MSEFISKPLVEIGPVPVIDPTRLFRPAQGNFSPIDNFMANTNAINKILVQAASDGRPSPELCSIIVLGYLSAVETYFRTVLSRLIHVDPISLRAVGNKMVPFSVAMSRPRETLAEALYEDSFASVRELKARLAEVGMGKLPQEIDTALVEYEKICHVRHCCVHRFGYLGPKNAADLGLADYQQLIGSIFVASQDELSDIADALQQIVKSCNNHLYRFVIDRTVDDQNKADGACAWKWTWSYSKDRKYFDPYYELFALRNGVPSSVPVKDAFKQFAVLNAKKADAMLKRNAAKLP